MASKVKPGETWELRVSERSGRLPDFLTVIVLAVGKPGHKGYHEAKCLVVSAQHSDQWRSGDVTEISVGHFNLPNRRVS